MTSNNSPATLLVNSNLVAVDDGVVREETSVWIEDGVIRRVGGNEVVAEAEDSPNVPRKVDVGGEYLVPGLFNLHTHFGLTYAGPDDRSPAARVLRMAINARNCLGAGVTTVRLVGEHDHTDFDLRAAMNRGWTDGPTIKTAGQVLCCTGGHGSGSGALELDGPAEFARGVRQQLTMGADVIKVTISGGIGGAAEEPDHSQLSDEEMKAVIDTAHGWGRKVTAHAGSPRAIKTAVELGLDGVEHGYNLDDEAIAAMVRHGTWLVPTLIVSRAEEWYRSLGAPDYAIRKATALKEPHLEAIRSAIAAGVNVALGTDMVPQQAFEGTTATVREMELLVEAGLPPVGALRAATTSAATYLDMSDVAGVIAEGRRADLIGVGSDPLQDISAMRDLRRVFCGGRPVAPTPQGLPAC